MTEARAALVLRIGPERQRGLLWVAVILLGVALGALQSVFIWWSFQQDPEMGLRPDDVFMAGSAISAWWIPAASAALFLAGALSGV